MALGSAKSTAKAGFGDELDRLNLRQPMHIECCAGYVAGSAAGRGTLPVTDETTTPGPEGRLLVTPQQLAHDLRRLGVREGGVVMFHTRMSALGWVVGGTQAIIEGLLDVVGPDGTLMAYAGWEDDPYAMEEWPPERQAAYRQGQPAFDPQRSGADPLFGRLPERLRTWPGALASGAHLWRFVALGPAAGEITQDAPWDYPVGPGSPLARLVDMGGQVLMLGAPLDTLSILHHAEFLVELPCRRLVHFEVPVSDGGQVVWTSVDDIDTSGHAFPYEELGLDEDAFAVMGQGALGAGAGASGTVGESLSYVFDARALVSFATAWLSAHFGPGRDAH